MSDTALAGLTRDGRGAQARFERRFAHPRAHVWAALTQSDRLAQWLAPGTLEMKEGGAAKLNFTDSGIVIDSVVTALDPGYLIEYSWSSPGEPARPVRWELDDADGGARLTLTLHVPAGEDVARACAGWEAHLDMLAAELEGVPIKFPFETFKAKREAYRQALSP